ncbi:MAG: DUF481 domain-containing protein [Kiritimatiellia bacterium]
MIKSLLMTFAFFLCGTLLADTITTTAGDTINGTITQIKGGKIVITTAFAGDLTIDREVIATFAYAEPGKLYARTDASKREKEEVTISKDASGNLLLIPTEKTAEALALDDVSTVWLADGEDPDFPPIKEWAYSFSIGLSGHSGGSSEMNLSAYADAVRTTEKETLKLYGSMKHTRSDHVDTARQYIAGLDFERRPWEHHSWYFRDEVQNNRFSDYKLHNVVAAGYGFYVWKTNTDGRVSMLRFRAGFAQMHIEKYSKKSGGDRKNKTEDETNLDFGILYHYDFACGVKWNTEITYSPEVSDLANGYIVHESKVQYTLNHLWNISSEAGVRNEYQTQTAPGVVHTDTTWYVRLKKAW